MARILAIEKERAAVERAGKRIPEELLDDDKVSR